MPDMWKGQPLEEMSKQELMDALREQAEMYAKLLAKSMEERAKLMEWTR
jgi:hypothetical protein